MAKYIDIDKAQLEFYKAHEDDGFTPNIITLQTFLLYYPPADVRPVVRGRWLLDSDPGEPWKYKCDKCGEVTNNTCMGKPRYNYCPMCGAYMSENDA